LACHPGQFPSHYYMVSDKQWCIFNAFRFISIWLLKIRIGTMIGSILSG
jgi:hypothetical protein